MVIFPYLRSKFPTLVKNLSSIIMNKSNKTNNPTKAKINLNASCKVNLTNAKQKFYVLETPTKSDSDKKEYKVIRLGNGLTACLISDKSPIENEDFEESGSESDSASEEDSTTESEGTEESSDEEHVGSKGSIEQKMAAAGLCIGVGSFSDPKNVNGMAHFLEHMVFMGSEKFPEENDFDSFIKKGGGHDNASTDAETTIFYFECLEKNLLEGLEKFAQFFISPLMKREAMTREREAVESEFQMAVSSDISRIEQLLCSFATKNSPVNSFPWGNLITLKENITDDELYKGVHEFRKRHYSAHRMTLAIQARLPTEELEEYVLQCFSDVPTNGLPGYDYSKYAENIFDTPEFNRVYYIKPIKDLRQINLTWALPSLKSKYRSKPHHYISYLLGDEGKGSLLSYLKKEVWALGTSIGNEEQGIEHNSLYTFFSVNLALTDQGFLHTCETIEAVFAYINMLKYLGPQERIFDEVKNITDTQFRFSQEERAVDFVEDLCESMQSYPPKDYLTGSELYYEYDPDAITMVLDKMTPDKVNILVLSRDLPAGYEFDKQEKWFGTEFTDREIPQDWKKQWKIVKPYPELSVPPPNTYITHDFTILPEIVNNPEYPSKILDNSFVELWYRRDQKFKLPIAYYYFYLINVMSIKSPKYACMVDMMVNLITIDIAEEIYPATSAGLSYEFSMFERGLVIKIYGFNEKLPMLINVISKYLTSLSEHLTPVMFNALKDKLLKSYHNKLLKPSGLAKDIRLNLLLKDHWNPADRYSAMLNVTCEDLKLFMKDYCETLLVKCLVQGNVEEEVAVKTVNEFVNNLKYKPLEKENYPKFKVIKVSKGERCCRIMNINTSDTNSIITNYYQSGPVTLKKSVILELIMLIIEEPLFDILRTKEQLGYHVYCSLRDTFGVLGYTVTVNAQATKNTTDYVDQRIENFLKHTQYLLKQMDQQEFMKMKSNLIKTKQCTDVHLKEEVDRNWSEITEDNYIFDRLKQEIDLIHTLEANEVREWWDNHNAFGNGENFRKLTIQVVGHEKKDNSDGAEYQLPTGQKIKIRCIGSKEDSKSENKHENYFIESIDDYTQSLSVFSFPHK
ncbi:nardilysin-like [Cylas formicarius]|uniref:nardilysin-like n=1 Tax=Cylas formicarius TaxID=197179 RepID=UPI002958947D|nr:nardilysin-like [Cylas formicarius]